MRIIIEMADLTRVSSLYVKGIMKPDVVVSDPKPEYNQNDDFIGVSVDIKPSLTQDKPTVE